MHTRTLLFLAAALGSLSGATVTIPNPQLPQTFTVAEGDFLELQFPDATFIFQGDSHLFADPALTVLDNIVRFVNVGGRGRIFFATAPATFGSLPPAGSDFTNDLFLAPGQTFSGSGPVDLHGGTVATATYVCTVRV